MYLSSWKRTPLFTIIPSLRNNDTYYSKKYIEDPESLDFWNFFIDSRKVKQLISMLKDNPQSRFISIEGDTILDTALHIQSLSLLKETLKHCNISMFISKNNDNLTVLDRIWNAKFSIYKEVLLYIKKNQLDTLFQQTHMLLLIESDLKKMIFFEKIFPDLFLILYNKKIDYLHPQFQYVLLKHNILNTKFKRKFKVKNNKKTIFKI